MVLDTSKFLEDFIFSFTMFRSAQENAEGGAEEDQVIVSGYIYIYIYFRFLKHFIVNLERLHWFLKLESSCGCLAQDDENFIATVSG